MERKVSRIWVLLAVILLLLTLTGCSKSKEVVKETALSVSTATAAKMDIAQSVSYAGKVKGRNEASVLAKTSARVTAVYVKNGDHVTAGQTLFVLDSDGYSAMVEQAQVGRRAAELTLATAGTNLERTKKLLEVGAVSKQQMEQAQSAYDLAEVGLAQADAAIKVASVQMDNCSITAPISGVAGNVSLSVGDMTSPQSAAAIISDTSQLEIEFLVSESEINYIMNGSSAKVSLKAVSDKSVEGKVTSVSTVPDPVTRNYAVKVALPNQDGKIRSGMFAELIIDTISKQNVLCVPLNAVIPKGGSSIIYTVDTDKKARPLDVQTGIKNNRYIEITQGLKAGQQVITKGNTLVNDGTLVRVVAGGGK